MLTTPYNYYIDLISAKKVHLRLRPGTTYVVAEYNNKVWQEDWYDIRFSATSLIDYSSVGKVTDKWTPVGKVTDSNIKWTPIVILISIINTECKFLVGDRIGYWIGREIPKLIPINEYRKLTATHK